MTDQSTPSLGGEAEESRWQQVVGNVISHQRASTSIFKRNLAKRTKDGIRVTDPGMDYLNNLGFSLKR
jgi:hypothetical protein